MSKPNPYAPPEPPPEPVVPREEWVMWPWGARLSWQLPLGALLLIVIADAAAGTVLLVRLMSLVVILTAALAGTILALLGLGASFTKPKLRRHVAAGVVVNSLAWLLIVVVIFVVR